MYIEETRRGPGGMKVVTSRRWIGPQMGEQTQEVPRYGICVVIHIAVREHPPISACTGEVFTIPSVHDSRPRLLCEPCRLKMVRA